MVTSGAMAVPTGGRAGVPRPSRAVGSAEHDSGAGPAIRPDEDGRGAPISSDWPLQSHLELAALPGAVPCARLHARQILWEWSQVALAEAVELLVSELVTNALQASAQLASGQHAGAIAGGVPTVRFWLASDHRRVLIQVWDSCDWQPQRQEPRPEAESGRGLLLVEALSSEWGASVDARKPGKVVWALIAAART